MVSAPGGVWPWGRGVIPGRSGPRGESGPRGGGSRGWGVVLGGWGVSAPGGVSGPGGCLVVGDGVWSWGPGGYPPQDGYCCGRYASYWNAFLFEYTIRIIRKCILCKLVML